MATTNTPALRASYAQETPTSAHISRKQQKLSSVYGTTASNPQRTSVSGGSNSTKYRLPSVQEAVLRQQLKSGAAASARLDQENIAPTSNASPKSKPSKRSNQISSSNISINNDTFKASARMSLSTRTDAPSPSTSIRVISQPSDTASPARHRQRHSSGEWWKVPQQAPAAVHAENPHDAEAREVVEMTPPSSERRKKKTPVMAGPQRRLAPTPELSQGTVIQQGKPESEQPSRSGSQVYVEIPNLRNTLNNTSSSPSRSRKSKQSLSQPTSSRHKRLNTALASANTSPSKSPNPRARKSRRTTLGPSASMPEALTSSVFAPATPSQSRTTKARAVPATDGPKRRMSKVAASKPSSRRSTGSTESKADARSRRRSVAPDFLVKRSGVLDVPPRPKSPSDDPLLLKGSFPQRSVSLSQNTSYDTEKDNSDQEEPLHSVEEEMEPGTPFLTSQYTPMRIRNEDVAMSSPNAGSPSPSERGGPGLKVYRAGSLPAVAPSRISLFGPSSSSRTAPNSVGRPRSTALPMLQGRLQQEARGQSAVPTNIAEETAAPLEEVASPSQQHIEEEVDPSLSARTRVDEPQAAEPRGRLRSPSPSGVQQTTSRFEAAAAANSDVNDRQLDTRDWLPADEWIMNERDSLTPELREESGTPAVAARSSSSIEEDFNVEQKQLHDDLGPPAVTVRSSSSTEEDISAEHGGEDNQELNTSDPEISRDQPLNAKDGPSPTPSNQSPQCASPEEPSYGSPAPERKRTTVVIRLDVTTVKVEPEEYGAWSSATPSGQGKYREEQPSLVGTPPVSDAVTQEVTTTPRLDEATLSEGGSAHASPPARASAAASRLSLAPPTMILGAAVPEQTVCSGIYPSLEEALPASPATLPCASDHPQAEVASATSNDSRELGPSVQPSPNSTTRTPVPQAAVNQVSNTEQAEDEDADDQAERRGSHGRPRSQDLRIYPTMADDESDESDDDMADVSIVEVYSRDPVAAARAAAILKMNYDYIEHGHPAPGTVTPRKAARRNRISLAASAPRYGARASSANKRLSLAELVHEAELDLAVGSPRVTTSVRAVSTVSTLDMPGALPASERQGGHQGIPRQPPIGSPSRTKAWKVNDWRDLERAYRKAQRRKTEKQRAGATSTNVRVDAEVVLTAFLQLQNIDDEDLEGEWDRSVLLLRIQALERRLTSTPMAPMISCASNTIELNDTEPRPLKRPRVEVEEDASDASSALPDRPVTAAARRLTNFFKGLQEHLPRPSLSLLASPTVKLSTASATTSTASSAESNAATVPEMRQVNRPLTEPSIRQSCAEDTLALPRSRQSGGSQVSAPSFSLPSQTSQHSQALAALFREKTSTVATHPIPIPAAQAFKPAPRISSGGAYSNSPSVKDLVRSFESFEEAHPLGDTSGSSLRRVTSTSSLSGRSQLRPGRNSGERRMTEN